MAGTADDVMEVCVVLFVVAHITKLGVVILMWAARKYCASSTPLCEEPLQWKHKHKMLQCWCFSRPSRSLLHTVGTVHTTDPCYAQTTSTGGGKIQDFSSTLAFIATHTKHRTLETD